ncbi:MAG: DUF4175 family protein, partial [Bacteroidota bacterium]
KYYINELIRGGILFFAIGLLYFLLTLLLEYFLWLNPPGRTVLFWLFIAVEAALFFKFIAIPVGRLFQFHRRISYREASNIIGNHFPEVNDKLLNLLQLAESRERSELLLASIEQRSSDLHPVPFRLAINLSENLKHTKYITLPVGVVLLIWISGSFQEVSKSYERVLNYQLAYEPPAPFQFLLVNETLNTIENKAFELQIKTIGKIIPENVHLHTGKEKYFMQGSNSGVFEYTFSNPREDITFYVSANGINSKSYRLRVTKVPALTDFQMELDYPAYTKKADVTIKNTGNVAVPEGTKITWHLKTKETRKVELILKDTSLLFSATEEEFKLARRFYNNAAYTISTSNQDLPNYENMGFRIDVLKDNYPEIEVTRETDTLNPQYIPFSGLISDDYGLTKLQLVYYPEGDEQDKKVLAFPLKVSNFSRFTYVFPENIQLEGGMTYQFYFEVFDNDALRGGKATKSTVFNYKKLTDAQRTQQQFEQQQETIENIDNSLKDIETREKELAQIARTNKEKEQLSFNEKRRLREFLERQQQQEQLMQQFTKELKDNLDDFQQENVEEDAFKELLKERLERQQKELERNEKLMEKLKEITDKIQQEELAKELEKLAKRQKNNKRNLEQLLELTKRYYVSAKASKLQQDLEKLARDQEELSEKRGKENTKEKQEGLNERFEEFQKEMDQLQQENKALKKPMELTQDKNAEQDIKSEQQNASENLERSEQQNNEQEQQQSQQKAQQQQKNAARKMKQMSAEMQQQMQAGSQQQAAEDAEMLRQILDNLVVFSFEQEALLSKFDTSTDSSPDFSKNLRRQNELRELFQHVDDSLFALSLRLPEVSETVNKEISEVYFNIDKALERLAETRIYQGVASQRYALTAANNLADFLSNTLDNMQEQLGMGSGQGNQPEMQLPDIIQSQEQLNQQMQNAMQQQSGEGEEKNKGKPNEGNSEQQGSEGESGEQDAGQLYEIYKQQQQLRQLLEQQLKDNMGTGAAKDAGELLKEMEQIENELLEKGLNEGTLQRMSNLKHQLLKLEEASFRQGKKQERESTTNREQFNTPQDRELPETKQYFNQVELLDRQAIHLHQIYKRKGEYYFKKDND